MSKVIIDKNSKDTGKDNEEESSSKVQRITDDDLYRNSSQYRLWSYNISNLEKKRIETNSRYVEKVKKNLETYIDQNKDTLSPEELSSIKSKAIPLTYSEELQLNNFYAKKVQVIAQHLNLPTEVVATSITFFKRFFLENSVMEYDPKDLVHTTIFLACKSENYFISVDTFAKKAKSKREEILKNEFKLLESLKFTLLNHHPYKSLHGFFLDIQNILYEKVDLNYMGKIYDRSKKRITDALLTDVVYHFTPPQITLAVLYIEDEQLIRRYLDLKFGTIENNEVDDKDINNNNIENKEKRDSTDVIEIKEEGEKNTEKENSDKEGKGENAKTHESKITSEKLIEIILSCKKMMESLQIISTQEAKLIYAKNYYCKNPDIIVQKLKRKREHEQMQEPNTTSTTTEPESKKPKV